MASPEDRQNAVDELARSRFAYALAVLHEVSLRADHPARAAAESAFAQSVELRPRLAFRHRNPAIRLRAIAVSAHGRQASAVAELSRVLRNANRQDVRCQAADALGRIAAPSCVSGLSAAVRDRSATVRRVALTALSRITSVKAERAVRQFLRDDDWSIRQQACQTLEASGWQPKTPAERTLSAIIHDRFDEAIRHGETSSRLLLHATLYGDDAATRRWAAIALQRVPGQRASEQLTARLSSREPGVRHAAAEALQLLGLAPRAAAIPSVGESKAETETKTVFARAIQMLALAGEP